MYVGLLIKESLSDERILDFVEIKNVDIWVTDKKPKYWTAVSFVSNCMDFPEKLSKVIRKDSQMQWYVDLKMDNTKYIILKDLVLKYEIGNCVEKENVIKKCIELGIPIEQLDWSEGDNHPDLDKRLCTILEESNNILQIHTDFEM